MLIQGQWQQQPLPTSKTGQFIRAESRFRDSITPDGRFTPEANRYHLFVAHACPWANRTTIMRTLKGLQSVISLSYVDSVIHDAGWTFAQESHEHRDPLYDSSHLHQLYTRANPEYTGRVTVPVLWDKHHETIVNNESAEIIRILNKAFNEFSESETDYYPAEYRHEIDDINEFIYNSINNGVYKCGFANSQQAYEEAYDQLFRALDKIEQRLSQQRYLIGNQITEADIRLFTTLIRFDLVYVQHFKCNRQRIIDYPNCWNYCLDCYQTPGFGETIDVAKIKQHYYMSHRQLNPTGIIPKGPRCDFLQAHDRGKFG